MRSIIRGKILTCTALCIVAGFPSSGLWAGVAPAAGLPKSAAATQPARDPWQVKLYLEDDVVASGEGTSLIVAVQSRAHQPATISTLVHLRRQPVDGATTARPTTAPAPPNEDEATRALLGNALRIVVTLRGRFPPGMVTALPVRSHRISALNIERGQSYFFPEPIAAGTLRKGDYELQAHLFDGPKIIGQSKRRIVRVRDTGEGEEDVPRMRD